MTVKLTKRIRAQKLQAKCMQHYGSYTLEDRAIPDYRDGLKPVQRRILMAMKDLKCYWDKNFKKASKIVGDTLGNYHPHGDASIAGALVNMAQAGKSPTRYPYVEGQGNWGSPSDGAGAPRYIEGRLHKASESMFECMPITTMVPNYDGTREEPMVFSSRLPYLILNGSEGIATAATTKIPSHNIKEVISALNEILVNKTTDENTILKHLKGPDFNGGSITSSRAEIMEFYKSGRGRVSYICDYNLEEKKGRKMLVVTNYAPYFNPVKFMDKVHSLRENGYDFTVYDDTSKENGIRITIQYSNLLDVQEEIVPLLRTVASYTFNVSERTEAEEDTNKFMSMNMVEFLQHWLDWRRDEETKLLTHEKEEYEAKKHKEDARLVIINNLKAFTTLMESCKTRETFKEAVKKKFKFDDIQTDFILDCKVVTLANLSKDEQLKVISGLDEKIKAVKEKLKDIDKWISSLLLKTKHLWDDRRTKVKAGTGIGTISDVYVLVGESGFMHRVVGLPSKDPIKKKDSEWMIKMEKDESSLYTVNNEGYYEIWERTEVEDDDLEFEPVNVFDNTDVDVLVTLSEKGNCSFVENPDKSHQSFRVKKVDEVTWGGGMRKGDTLWVYDADDTKVDIISYAKAKSKAGKHNLTGNLLFKEELELQGVIVGKDEDLINERGNKITDKNLFLRANNFFVVGKNNSVKFKTGELVKATREEAIKMIKENNKVVNVFSL